MAQEKVTIIFDGDTKQIDKDIKELDADIKKSSSSVSDGASGASKSLAAMGTAAVSAAAAGVAAFAVLGNATTNHTNKLNAITNAYGENEAAARSYAETTAALLGTTTDDFLTQASAIAITAENYGLAEESAQKYGLAVSTVGAALGAVNVAGLNTEESTKALAAAMRGEAESAEALGLSLGQTAMEQYAAANGATENFNAMSQAEQMAWRLSAAIAQTGTALGLTLPPTLDMATLMSNLSLITQSASEELSGFQILVMELKTALQALLVGLTPVIEAISALLIPLLQVTTQIIQALAVVVSDLVVRLQPLVDAVVRLTYALGDGLVWIIEWISQLNLLQGIFAGIETFIINATNAFWGFIDALRAGVSAVTDFLTPFNNLGPTINAELNQTVTRGFNPGFSNSGTGNANNTTTNNTNNQFVQAGVSLSQYSRATRMDSFRNAVVI